MPKTKDKPLPNLVLSTVTGGRWSLHDQRFLSCAVKFLGDVLRSVPGGISVSDTPLK